MPGGHPSEEGFDIMGRVILGLRPQAGKRDAQVTDQQHRGGVGWAVVEDGRRRRSPPGPAPRRAARRAAPAGRLWPPVPPLSWPDRSQDDRDRLLSAADIDGGAAGREGSSVSSTICPIRLFCRSQARLALTRARGVFRSTSGWSREVAEPLAEQVDRLVLGSDQLVACVRGVLVGGRSWCEPRPV